MVKVTKTFLQYMSCVCGSSSNDGRLSVLPNSCLEHFNSSPFDSSLQILRRSVVVRCHLDMLCWLCRCVLVAWTLVAWMQCPEWKLSWRQPECCLLGHLSCHVSGCSYNYAQQVCIFCLFSFSPQFFYVLLHSLYRGRSISITITITLPLRTVNIQFIRWNLLHTAH